MKYTGNNQLLGNEVSGPKGFVNYWSVTPLPDSFKLKGEACIPYNKLPLLNDDFGTAHGDLTVRENDLTPGAIQKDVKVFFRKDDMNYNDDKLPNWFFYWSQIPTGHKNVSSIKFYDPDNGNWKDGDNINMLLQYKADGKYAFDENKVYLPGDFVTYGSHTGGDTENIGKQSIGQTKDPGGKGQQGDGLNYVGWKFIRPIIITIGKACGYYDISDKENIKGISVFAETYFHELEHWQIFYENWKDGYQSDLDLDKDGYNDEWEVQNFVENKWEFKPNQDDSYNPNYKDYTNDTAGTYFEEQRCSDVQKLFITSMYNEDWSYDSTKKYQGKQWK